MKSILAVTIAACLLGLAAYSAQAELCTKCKDMMFTTDIGKCIVCGADTSSGAKKLCPKCSEKLGVCEACKAKLTPASQSADKAVVELDEACNGKTVEVVVGAKICITLKGNITTGYSWDVKKVEGDAEKQDGKVDYASKPAKPNMVGAGGAFTAVFKAEKEGKAVITLAYFRPWEKDKAPAETFTVTVDVKMSKASCCDPTSQPASQPTTPKRR